MSVERLIELWNEDVDMELWLAILTGLFFLVCNFVLFGVMWFCRKGALQEYGYPKRKRKYLRKRFKEYSFAEKLFLVRLVREADQIGLYSYMLLLFNFLNTAAFGVSIVGFVASCITSAGWARFLLIMPVFTVFGVTVILEFIPDLIWLPSERRRYKRK